MRFLDLNPPQQYHFCCGLVSVWASSELALTEAEREAWARQGFGIENYHRGIKQCCGIEKCQARSEAAQRGHIQLALRAFVRLETHWWNSGISWYQAKADIIRTAIRAYLAQSRYLLPADSTA